MSKIDWLNRKAVENIKQKLKNEKIDYGPNQNISSFVENLTQDERCAWFLQIEDDVKSLLEDLLIDVSEYNVKETSSRMAKMFLNEIFIGRYQNMPKVTAFPNEKKYDQIYLSGPIEIRSTCAHHFQPIVGNAWIGIFPGEKVLGLSKFNRLIDWVCRRPQIQEEMTEQIGELIERVTEAKGVAVVIKATHFCVTHRGVMAGDSDMTTSVMRGDFRDNHSLKKEFFDLVKGMKGYLQ